MALLDRATNFFGPLDSKVRARILTFFEQPTEEHWNDIFSIIINDKAPLSSGARTIWQAVIAVDPTFPRVGPSGRGRRWARIPDPMTVARAIRAATK